MKKSINVLVEKLTENEKGQFTGGFGSIKGGFNIGENLMPSDNPGDCVNGGDCSSSSNGGKCTNSRIC
ncbi:hypothetical protein [Sphingobacterium corticibacter]|uniref:Uncharacterized protein n=1 Tax=Sphingobacterium corticibacter TaxID=2171749 RepID=A0A2T8HG30_9SPHI|nr:hypothetical protein [Sphingobacterium corticibacter]PVH24397.1 hypothetical protein DC487_15060 [Sphingobacterium corticibacter]